MARGRRKRAVRATNNFVDYATSPQALINTIMGVSSNMRADEAMDLNKRQLNLRERVYGAEQDPNSIANRIAVANTRAKMSQAEASGLNANTRARDLDHTLATYGEQMDLKKQNANTQRMLADTGRDSLGLRREQFNERAADHNRSMERVIASKLDPQGIGQLTGNESLIGIGNAADSREVSQTGRKGYARKAGLESAELKADKNRSEAIVNNELLDPKRRMSDDPVNLFMKAASRILSSSSLDKASDLRGLKTQFEEAYGKKFLKAGMQPLSPGGQEVSSAFQEGQAPLDYAKELHSLGLPEEAIDAALNNRYGPGTAEGL